MNFRVVENAPSSWIGKYDNFCDLYNNSDLTVVEIRKKLDLSIRQYTKIRKKALKEGKIVDRRSTNSIANNNGRPPLPQKQPRNYSRLRNGKFTVVKRFYRNSKTVNIYCGIYDDEEVAKRIVEEMRKVNWDIKYLPKIKEEVLYKCKR